MQKFAINTYQTIRIIRRRTVQVPKTKPIALVKKRSYKFAAKLPLRRITMIVAKNSVNYPYFKGVSNPRTRNILSLDKFSWFWLTKKVRNYEFSNERPHWACAGAPGTWRGECVSKLCGIVPRAPPRSRASEPNPTRALKHASVL